MLKAWEVILIIVVFLILGGATLWLGMQFSTKGVTCMENPIEYYQQLKNVTCWCSNFIS